MQKTFWLALMLLLAGVTEASAWNRKAAFERLEARQAAWAAWKPAQKAGGPCISCHTGLSYLFARRAAGEPLAAEQRRVMAGVLERAAKRPPVATLPDAGAEVVLNLFVLSQQRTSASAAVSAVEQTALEALWAAQVRTGQERGSWTWVDADLEPFDSTSARFFGTALAAQALALYPRQSAERVAELDAYLARAATGQPLHHRLAWAAFAGGGGAASKARILDELWRAQSGDGGWTTAALGPWSKREPGAPADPGSNAYATAWAAFTAQLAGVACTDARLVRALVWLDRNQRRDGSWYAPSPNKTYARDSIQEGFMSDAATGYAAAALVKCPLP